MGRVRAGRAIANKLIVTTLDCADTLIGRGGDGDGDGLDGVGLLDGIGVLGRRDEDLLRVDVDDGVLVLILRRRALALDHAVREDRHDKEHAQEDADAAACR